MRTVEQKMKWAAYMRKWRKDNPQKTAAIDERKYLRARNSPEKLKHYRKLAKKRMQCYRQTAKYLEKRQTQEFRDKANARNSKWQKTSGGRKAKRLYQQYRRQKVEYRLHQSFSARVNQSLQHGKNGRPWEKLVGYTLAELKAHLEKRFQQGMLWNNYGKFGWHIDHIVPVAVFDFSSFDDEQFKRCWALSNLQPLWAKDNWEKNSKVA